MKSSTKKNVTLLGVGAALCLATAASLGAMSVGKASAAEITSNGGTATVAIEYTTEDSWKVTIPESITIGTAAKIEATDVNIAEGETLKVTLKGTSQEKWELTEDGGSDKIEYTVKKGDSIDTQETTVNVGDAVLEVTSGNKESYIKAEVEGNKSTGGKTYKDTLTFTANVANN